MRKRRSRKAKTGGGGGYHQYSMHLHEGGGGLSLVQRRQGSAGGWCPSSSAGDHPNLKLLQTPDSVLRLMTIVLQDFSLRGSEEAAGEPVSIPAREER